MRRAREESGELKDRVNDCGETGHLEPDHARPRRASVRAWVPIRHTALLPHRSYYMIAQ
jgi:hypothetical protein